ncbi:bidirectional sugar transporter SWEET4-like [Chenopodium quinoa]|uniref:bidirectional sugar transporter SWEET4-like n=1 Tax=Chenopodium quinoa TaxID=63459 RepID=UPI000B7867DE|nr:bidirectional sugar transporter SWEET4-like [Chenopodium quinoa]
MMMNLDLPTILGIIGNVTSFFMFCSLAPTIWRIYLQKDNEEYKFHPIVAGLISCSMWVLYSMPFVHSNPHSILLTPVNNCVGIALYIFYYVVYSYYGDSFSRKSMCIYLYAEVVVLFVLICITLLAFHTHTSWSNFVGIFYVIFGILFYGAPLTVMLKVITTKSVEYMPLSLSIAGLFNGVIWSAYACIKKFDHYILICNAAGAILAVAKLILYTWYYVSAQKESIETLPTPPHHDSRKSSMVILVSYYDKEP